MTNHPVLIAGGGIGGLATALTLHQIGVPCTVLEGVREMKPLGVGINLQPNAVHELHDLGIAEAELDAIGLPAREWALVGLNGKGDRFPHQLSGGEQQRVSIARAFVNRPLILLADEPTGNLDPQTSEGIMRLLDRINKTGTTVVMATHDQRIVNMMRRRVIQLDRGTIVRDQARGVYE